MKKTLIPGYVKSYFEHLQKKDVMPSMALCKYVHIYQPLQKDKFTEDELLNDTELYRFIRDLNFTYLLAGDEYQVMSRGYLGFNENFFNEFYKFKISLNYPHLKVATCLEPIKSKQYLIEYINKIFNNEHEIVLTSKQEDYSKSYREFVFFCVKHVLFYCAHFDKEFLELGKKLFNDFETSASKEKINSLIALTLNEHITSYREELNEAKKNQQYLNPLIIEDKRIRNLYEHIQYKKPVDKSLFKIVLNSHEKGKLGENLFGDLTEGEVVGHKNNKTDIIEEGKNISLKTSYSSSWNHHLAYLNQENNAYLIEALKNKTSFFKLKDINWINTIDNLLSGDDIINELVFQKVTMDELNKEAQDIKIWRFSKDKLVDIIRNKQFIFQNNNIILFHEQEQFLKLHFKKRTDKYQVMVSVDEQSLQNVVENNFGQFSHPKVLQIKTKYKA